MGNSDGWPMKIGRRDVKGVAVGRFESARVKKENLASKWLNLFEI